MVSWTVAVLYGPHEKNVLAWSQVIQTIIILAFPIQPIEVPESTAGAAGKDGRVIIGVTEQLNMNSVNKSL